MASVSLSDNSDSVISGMPFDGEKDSLSADGPSRLRRIVFRRIGAGWPQIVFLFTAEGWAAVVRPTDLPWQD